MSLSDVIARARNQVVDETTTVQKGLTMARTFSCDVFKDRNQLLVDSLMARMHGSEVGRTIQALPTAPCIPNLAIRKLRAKLILEEALETIAGLGIDVMARDKDGHEAATDGEFFFSESQIKPTSSKSSTAVVTSKSSSRAVPPPAASRSSLASSAPPGTTC